MLLMVDWDLIEKTRKYGSIWGSDINNIVAVLKPFPYGSICMCNCVMNIPIKKEFVEQFPIVLFSSRKSKLTLLF